MGASEIQQFRERPNLGAHEIPEFRERRNIVHRTMVRRAEHRAPHDVPETERLLQGAIIEHFKVLKPQRGFKPCFDVLVENCDLLSHVT